MTNMEFLLKHGIYLLGCLLLISCDKDDQPIPSVETSQLEQTIAGNYWDEKIHFMRFIGGWDIEVKEEADDILKTFGWAGGNSYSDFTTLDKIYVEPNTNRVRRYIKNKYDGYSEYYQNNYTIEYDDKRGSICISSPNDVLSYMGAATGSEMKIISISDEEIIFDAPIKPFIAENWHVDKLSESHGCEYLGIRIHWTKEDPERFKFGKPID